MHTRSSSSWINSISSCSIVLRSRPDVKLQFMFPRRKLVIWQRFSQPLTVALGNASGDSRGSYALGYGSVRLVSAGHYPAVGLRLATGIAAANYAGIREAEKKIINTVNLRNNM